MRYLYLMCAVLFFSCSRKQPFAETKDKDLLIQVIGSKGLPDSAGLEYKVRIFQELKKEATDDKKLREKMMYQVDSVFYRMEGLEKQYAEGVTPIANGIKNCFEYLVVFPGTKPAGTHQDILIYQDKYINNKTYQLILK